jgi:hypothetical protein
MTMAADLTASESAILIVLMAEAREVLNTELQELYGLDVRKTQRDKLTERKYIASKKSGRTYALQLADEGWVRVQDDLDFKLRGAGALGAALAALQNNLRDRVLARASCANLGELFALNDIRGAESDHGSEAALRIRIVGAYEALADKPHAWVSLRRLRPFFPDVPRSTMDGALAELSREDGVNIVPESNRKTLTEADVEAALDLGGQENHLLAIGV